MNDKNLLFWEYTMLAISGFITYLLYNYWLSNFNFINEPAYMVAVVLGMSGIIISNQYRIRRDIMGLQNTPLENKQKSNEKGEEK